MGPPPPPQPGAKEAAKVSEDVKAVPKWKLDEFKNAIKTEKLAAKDEKLELEYELEENE
jgi:hypothetical protein